MSILVLVMETHACMIVATDVRWMARSSLAELSPMNWDDGRDTASSLVMLLFFTRRASDMVWSGVRSVRVRIAAVGGPRNMAEGGMT